MNGTPAPESSAEGSAQPLTSALLRMGGRPFGRDEAGRPIDHGSGKLVVGAIEWMQTVVGQRADREAPAELAPAERASLIARAQSEALDRLVAMLNDAIDDERYHISRDYLLNASNKYSYEFRLFLNDYARVISGDPDFFFNHGATSIPSTVVRIGRPLGIQQVYALLPRFTAMFVKTDLRVVRTTATSAVIRLYAADQAQHVPPEHRLPYLQYACHTYQGAYAAIPARVFGLPPARIREISCQAEGAECCEWEFTWQHAEQHARRARLWVGGVGSLLVLAYALLWLPGARWLALGASLLPALLAWYSGRLQSLTDERARQEMLLHEQRDLAEAQYDRSEQANAELQLVNTDLRQRIAELTTVHEVGLALSAMLDLDALLDASLRAVVTHLNFERALVMLVDEARQVLTGGRSVGGTPEMAAVIAQLEISLDNRDSLLVQVLRADRALIFHDVDQALARALGATAFVGTPLVTNGRGIGILGVDNGVSGRPVGEADAALLFTVGSQIVTAVENARLYRQIEEQNRTLEQRVQQRTSELAQAIAEAQESRAAAEAANAAKSTFLANVSHELRTPLTSVLGFTKIIRKRLDEVVYPAVTASDPRIQRAMRQVSDNLGIIVAEGERLTAMINDVLDLAKIEAGKLEWNMQPVAVAEIVARASSATSALFAQKELPLVIEVPDELPAVVGDLNRLIQVVINLLSNAVKFTDSGQVTCKAARSGDEIAISVSDTGRGIAPEEHARVFEQFKQVGDTLTDKPQGTGLGLAICKQIVEHHGGRVWLASALGTGSTLTFTLPLAPAPEAATTTVETATLVRHLREHAGAGQRARPAGPKAILIVDDDDRLRELLRQELDERGYRVREAADGRAAIDAVQTEQPDLIILDVMLPELTGFEVAATLKNSPKTAGVPILMLSVLDDATRAYRMGVDRYVTKPFDANALAREVSMLVSQGLGDSPGDIAL